MLTHTIFGKNSISFKMPVIIDTPMKGWSHMTASSIDELHKFAQDVGINRCFFENKRGKFQPHYDIREKFYSIVVEAGAKPVTRREFFTFITNTYKPKDPEARKG